MKIINRDAIDPLFSEISQKGYTLVGPTVREETIIYDEIDSSEDLPIGVTDEQNNGIYRLKKRSDHALFGYNVGPHAWKKFLFPPEISMWKVKQTGNDLEIFREEIEDPKFAFIGVRSCELHAIAIQDQIFIHGDFVNPLYRSRRENALIIAVNCTRAGETCFCASMKTGPKVENGFDLALTEIVNETDHYFVVEIGSDRGAEIIEKIPQRSAKSTEIETAENLVASAEDQMGRNLDTSNLRDVLYQNSDHPQWEKVADRCMACANCTMVCPTCFCSTVEDLTDLAGETAERVQKWDSCFTMDFSYIHGGSVRSTTKSRYRQWLTHKFASWHDQFGSSGCVGCGRCITWCPVGIDVTAEIREMRK